MLIKLQAYYCCWTDLVNEMRLIGRRESNIEFEVQFFGNSRHHYEGCPVFLEINRQKEYLEINRQNEERKTPFGSIR